MSTKRSIYYSDFNEKSRQDVTRLLNARGFEVTVFANGEDAMAAAKSKKPDLFLTSMGLGGKMDGLKYVRALKANDSLKAIPVVLLTGAHQIMHLPFNFEPDPKYFPVTAVVEKPARADYLVEVLEEAIGKPAA